MKQQEARLIYNPHAGKKRTFLPFEKGVTLEDIQRLLDQYQIPVIHKPTHSENDAQKIAQDAIKENCKLLIVAGGDGSIGAIAKEVIGTDVAIAILPLGSFMNIARMLSVPKDLEKAIQIIKIGRTRKIDAGKITMIDGKKLKKPLYFFEEAGLGIEAGFHYHMNNFMKNSHIMSLINLVTMFFNYYKHSLEIYLDGKKIKTKTTMMGISNGSHTWAALNLASNSKLNDHKLTVLLYYMSTIELTWYFIKLFFRDRVKTRKVQKRQAKKIRVVTKRPRLVHADASIIGRTPVEFEVVPNAVTFVSGFPTPDEAYLVKRTVLDP